VKFTRFSGFSAEKFPKDAAGRWFPAADRNSRTGAAINSEIRLGITKIECFFHHRRQSSSCQKR
jgi:hypothetical protein